ncbi:MAG: hypothetical protein MUF23_10620 [Pirellula sp.]|jgi:hypothetical protein|nr:hypothetical protein [Pirellula sp.]
MTLRISILFVAWSVFAVCAALAQDPFDDFGGNTNPSGGQANASTNPSETSIEFDPKERDAVVMSLRRNPPEDPIALAKAIQWMARIRRWDEAGRWLDRLASKEITPIVALNIVESIGSQALLDLESQVEGLNETHRATVFKIRQLAADALRDPKTLATRVDQLRSLSKGERLDAFDALKAAGASGITAMLNGVMTENASAPTNSMIEAFSLLGDSATRAWQVAMTTPHADARQRLVALVARAPKAHMGCELMAELHDPEVSDAVREVIQRSLIDRQRPVPTAEQVHRYALSLVDQSLLEYQRRIGLNEVDTEMTWNLESDGRTLTEISAVPAQLYLSRASQTAQVALRLVSESDLASATAVAAHWEYLSNRGVVDASEDHVFQSVVPQLLRDSHEFCCLIWDATVKHRLFGAQPLAIANLTRWEGAGIPVPVRERLVAATRSGHAMVRYPATISLMKSQMEAAQSPSDNDETVAAGSRSLGFDGSSRISAVGREMQQLSNEPTALIIGGNEELRGYMHGLLDQFGYRYFEAGSVADVFYHLRSGLPLEAIFVVDHLRDLDLGQVIQRIRYNPSTARVPIAVLADSLSRGEHAIADEDPQVIMGSVPPTIDGLGDIVGRMLAVSDRPALTFESRILFRESANNYFRNVQPAILPSSADGRDVVMASTREEQQNLLRIAADSTQSVSKREQASQIFVQSVRRFGLLITSEMARDQYDVYNTRGELEPVIRDVFVRILDAIEANNGQRSWSEVTP